VNNSLVGRPKASAMTRLPSPELRKPSGIFFDARARRPLLPKTWSSRLTIYQPFSHPRNNAAHSLGPVSTGSRREPGIGMARHGRQVMASLSWAWQASGGWRRSAAATASDDLFAKYYRKGHKSPRSSVRAHRLSGRNPFRDVAHRLGLPNWR
jgi:hypothetical protein